VNLNAKVREHGFSLTAGFTDAHGDFRLAGCSPATAQYTVSVAQPGIAAENVPVDFHQLPLTVRLTPGLRLTGRVVNSLTGNAQANRVVRAWAEDDHWPEVTVQTDADGNYGFTTLGRTSYRIYVIGGNFKWNFDNAFQAGVVTNLLLAVKP
jgi:hypothetical protein